MTKQHHFTKVVIFAFCLHFILCSEQELQRRLNAMESRLNISREETRALKRRLSAVETHSGSTFVRWGRTTCPAGTTVIYSGVAGSSFSDHTGGGTNKLCMTLQPVFDNTNLMDGHGTLVGGEYYIPGHVFTDVVCTVCHTLQSATFMVAGTNRCPPGSVEQYNGYLSSGNTRSAQPSEYLCLDSAPEDRTGSQGRQDCGWFDHVNAQCGSLPCPPYIDNKVLTCAVCSL